MTIPADFSELADTRCNLQMDDETGHRQFRDFLRVLAEQPQLFYEVALDVRDGFDRETAVGDQLDMIGSIVDLAREGFADDRYRELLDIQIELLLSAARDDAEWTGTVENILRIARKFVGPGDPIVYTAAPPYDFLLSVPGLDMAESQLFMRFIRKAIYAGVLGAVIVSLDEGFIMGSVFVSVPGADIMGSTDVAVTDAAVMGTVLLT